MFRFDETDDPLAAAADPTRTPPVGPAEKPADPGNEPRESDIPPWFA
jgi:hypothetical protein